MGWLGLVSVTAGVEALAHFNRCLPYDLLSSHAVAAGMRLHHICAVAVGSRLGAEANVGPPWLCMCMTWFEWYPNDLTVCDHSAPLQPLACACQSNIDGKSMHASMCL